MVKQLIKKGVLLIACFMFLGNGFSTAQNNLQKPSKTLKVGVAGSKPFVFEKKTPRTQKGIALDIWEEIADQNEYDYQYKIYENVNTAIKDVKHDQLDLLIGPISITSNRVEDVSFSQAYYQSSLSIISRAEDPSLWDRVKPMFSFKLIFAVGGFLIILAVVGSLFWLSERKISPEHFSSHPVKGIGNGMWLAIVTMTTVGYGDMAPATGRGRIIAGTWMVISIIFATSMVAGIASTLTLANQSSSIVTNVEQLSGKKAATISSSPAINFLKTYKAKVTEVESIEEAMDQLMNKKVDAVVYDRPQLLFYMKNHKDENLYLAKAEYYKQGYGFAFPFDSPLVNEVNKTLLELSENHTVNEIVGEYLAAEE